MFSVRVKIGLFFEIWMYPLTGEVSYTSAENPVKLSQLSLNIKKVRITKHVPQEEVVYSVLCGIFLRGNELKNHGDQGVNAEPLQQHHTPFL